MTDGDEKQHIQTNQAGFVLTELSKMKTNSQTFRPFKIQSGKFQNIQPKNFLAHLKTCNP